MGADMDQSEHLVRLELIAQAVSEIVAFVDSEPTVDFEMNVGHEISSTAAQMDGFEPDDTVHLCGDAVNAFESLAFDLSIHQLINRWPH